MKLKWTLIADIELLELVTYIHPRNRRAALRLHLRARQRVLQLERFPYSGKLGRIDGTRELVIGKSQYIAVYSVNEDSVTIHHILHTSRQWPPEAE